MQTLAGKTAWIERVGRMDAAQVKQRAHLFAVQTDAELRRLKGLAQHSPIPTPESSPSLDLDDLRAQQVAVAYFRRRYEQMLEAGSLFLGRDESDYAVILAEAVEDRKAALASASGNHVDADPRALKLLVAHGVISETQCQSLMKDGWPVSLSGHRDFQFLCRLIERADLELARLRLEALQRGAMPAINDSLFAGSFPHAGKARGTEWPSKSLGDLIDLFLDMKKGKVSRSRFRQYEIPVRALKEHFGPKIAGVWQARKYVFHSFRGNFNDALREAGASKEHREAINGWREQRAMDDRYGHGAKVEMLAAEVSKVQFSGLKVDHLLAKSVQPKLVV
ncbi:hypothetical protein [Mesorhizobium sp. KR1-2]|uniref:hypothetical protein n=1 Tax=Mesorhizobium sp. KR1-2 TaxID=3156609 RepID=UPI0032B34411